MGDDNESGKGSKEMGRGAQVKRRICGQYKRITVSIRRVTTLESVGARQDIEKILWVISRAGPT